MVKGLSLAVPALVHGEEFWNRIRMGKRRKICKVCRRRTSMMIQESKEEVQTCVAYRLACMHADHIHAGSQSFIHVCLTSGIHPKKET